ncbi:MAG: hypothetical protein KME15_23895 [Drouetiella hepatica Uher 2000/2452]|jgi:hypothetical protein|uniref:Uncharacterized protein n=1 Tax=Drouetiella hepatica Uher 2000/2452 TaxID=904376 RepID=A0A951QFM2_9CYAN|nr:hypothetical protein [Drouetiella hepatica Uher 2000/2452]
MKTNVNSDAGSNAATSGASVPISVYRELAAELQATHVMLESLNTKNQHLAQQNQQLRKEVERVVQLGVNLQHWIESPPVDPLNAGANASYAAPSVLRQPASPSSAASASAIAAKLRTSDFSEQLFTEEPALPYDRRDAKSPRDFSGLWLTVTILLIVVSAFGAGFLVMKPFLSGGR